MDTEHTNRNMYGHTVRWWLLLALVLVAVMIVSWKVHYLVARKRLLHAMLDGGSYSLQDNPSTKSLVKAIVPELLDHHQKAVTECGSAQMTDLTRMDAFNRRIASWHAILMAFEFTNDMRARQYIDTFIRSELALSEEVKHGKRQLNGTGPISD